MQIRTWFKTSPKLAVDKFAKFHPASLRKLGATEQQELGKKIGKILPDFTW